MADLAMLKQRTSYNSGRKLLSEIRQLKTFVVQHKLGWYVQFVANMSYKGNRLVTNKQTNKQASKQTTVTLMRMHAER